MLLNAVQQALPRAGAKKMARWFNPAGEEATNVS